MGTVGGGEGGRLCEVVRLGLGVGLGVSGVEVLEEGRGGVLFFEGLDKVMDDLVDRWRCWGMG